MCSIKGIAPRAYNPENRMARKRSRHEFDQIEDVKGPTPSSSIHGALVSLLPVKKGRKSTYFNGVLADESSQIKLVGFNGRQQRKLNEYHQKNIAVQLEDCKVKAARRGGGGGGGVMK